MRALVILVLSVCCFGQIPRSYFGIHVSGLTATTPTSYPTFSGAIRVGIGSGLKMNNIWKCVSPNTDGSCPAGTPPFDFTKLDKYAQAAVDNKAQTFLYTATGFPRWSNSGTVTQTNAEHCATYGEWTAGTLTAWQLAGECDRPDDLNVDGTGTDVTFKTFIQTFRDHMQTNFPSLHVAIELFNEPNAGTDIWADGPWAGGAALARMALDAHTLLSGYHASDGTAYTLLSPPPGGGGVLGSNGTGVCSAGGPTGSYYLKCILTATYSGHQLLEYVDGVDTHMYVGNVTSSAKNPEQVLSAAANERAIMTSLGISTSVPLINSEFGWQLNTTLSDPEWQAGFLWRAFLSALPYATQSYWYEYDLSSAGTLYDRTLSGPNYLTKAGSAYLNLVSLLSGAVVGTPVLSGTTYTATITKPGTSYSGLLVWSVAGGVDCSSTCTTVSYTPSSIYKKYTTIYGVATAIAVPGTTVLQIGVRPLLLDNQTIAIPHLGFYRWWNLGSQTVVAGRTLLYTVWPMWADDMVCTTDSKCYFPSGYVPTGAERFQLDPDAPPPGGMQNLYVYGTTPRYKALNIGTDGHFNLARSTPSGLLQTSFLASPGTTSTVLSGCSSTNHIVTFSGGGAASPAQYLFTITGGVLSNPVPINWGGNYTSVPISATADCSSTVLTFSGGKLGNYVSITSNAPITAYIFDGGYANTNLYIQDTAGTGWPTGTKIAYWNPNNTALNGCMQGKVSFPLSGATGWGSSSFGRCAEVSIPSNASGTFSAGWKFCGNLACTSATITMLRSYTVLSIPDYAQVYPTSIPALPSYATSPTLCLSTAPGQGGTTVSSSNCSFPHLISGAPEQNGASHWCSNRVNPDMWLELAVPPDKMCWSSTCQALVNQESIWYYDGARTYEYIAAYTGDSTWLNCSNAIRSRYVQMGPGVPGIKGNPVTYPYDTLGQVPYNAFHPEQSFPTGLVLGLKDFNEGVYSSTPVSPRWSSQMVIGLWAMYYQTYVTKASPDYNFGISLQPAGDRGTAYALDLFTDMVQHLGTKTRNSDGTLTSFGQLYEQWVNAAHTLALQSTNPTISGPYDLGPTAWQYWMEGGLIVEALMKHWELTHDNLDLYCIKSILDIIKANYNSTTFLFQLFQGIDGGAPIGPWCDGAGFKTPYIGWYAGNSGSGDCSPMPVASAKNFEAIDGMLASHYAWWWRNFGGSDNSFATFADTMFTNAIAGDFNHAAFRYTGKAFNEEMGRYGFEYLRYRSGR